MFIEISRFSNFVIYYYYFVYFFNLFWERFKFCLFHHKPKWEDKKDKYFLSDDDEILSSYKVNKGT